MISLFGWVATAIAPVLIDSCFCYRNTEPFVNLSTDLELPFPWQNNHSYCTYMYTDYVVALNQREGLLE